MSRGAVVPRSGVPRDPAFLREAACSRREPGPAADPQRHPVAAGPLPRACAALAVPSEG